MKTMKSWMVLGAIVSMLLFLGGRWERGYWATGPEIMILMAMAITAIFWVLMGGREDEQSTHTR